MEIEIEKNFNLRRLSYWLNYSLSSITLFWLSFFFNIALIIFSIAAIIFAPFMLKVLYEERKWGWIIFFIVIVVLPLATVFIFLFKTNYFQAIGLIPLAFFYLYCFLLRLTIVDWLD